MPRDQTKAGVGAAGRRRINLSPDMLANIHGQLSCRDRLAFASVFREARDAFKPEAPWLVFPGETPETAMLFSLTDRRAAAVRAPDPALRGYVVLGSSRGWLATADGRGQMSLVNPVTGEQRALPAITTIPCLESSHGGNIFNFQLKPFVRGPPYAGGREPCGTFTLRNDQLGHLYRKVVLSESPGSGHGATAMLITGSLFGVAAFAMAEDAAWRLTPSRDGVEDAIHHDGKFYSVTYSGAVEAWEHDAGAGVFTSAAVTPMLADACGHPYLCRKYLVAAPGGRLMLVLKTDKHDNPGRWTCSFKVHVLDRAQWKEMDDVGDAALFVVANELLCVSTRLHPELKAGRVYYTENGLSRASSWKNVASRYDDGQGGVGVFCLKSGAVEDVEGLCQHRSWPLPAWFTPSNS